jgi:hypothetical protein
MMYAHSKFLLQTQLHTKTNSSITHMSLRLHTARESID